LRNGIQLMASLRSRPLIGRQLTLSGADLGSIA
jgi:hypothetical protein